MKDEQELSRRQAERQNEAYEAIEASLRDYLDQRLVQISDGDGNVRQAGVASGFRKWRLDLYFAILAVLLIANLVSLLWRPSAETTAGAQTAREAGASPRPAQAPPPAQASEPVAEGEEIVAPPFDLARASEAWAKFLADQADLAKPWLLAVAAASGLAADEVSNRQKANFTAWSEALGGTRDLADSQIANLRIGLFEYIYGRFCRSRADFGKAWQKVDLVIGEGEYEAAALAALVDHLDLERWFSPPFEASDAALQTAIVMRWVESQSPEKQDPGAK